MPSPGAEPLIAPRPKQRAPSQASYPSSLIEDYLREHAPVWAPRTLQVMRQSLDTLRPHLEENGLTQTAVLRFVAEVRSRPWSSCTVRHRLSSVRSLFRWAFRAGRTLQDLGSLIEVPRGKTLPRTLSEDEVLRLLEACRSARDRALVEVLYGTGLRALELLRLTLADVDLRETLVHVGQGKGRKDRILPFGERVKEAIRRYLREERAALGGEALFVTPSGERLSRSGLWMIIRRTSERARLARHASPHRLRHSYATHLLRGGADIVSIQKLLGHADLRSTEVYTDVEVSDLREVIARCHPRERGGRIPRQ